MSNDYRLTAKEENFDLENVEEPNDDNANLQWRRNYTSSSSNRNHTKYKPVAITILSISTLFLGYWARGSSHVQNLLSSSLTSQCNPFDAPGHLIRSEIIEENRFERFETRNKDCEVIDWISQLNSTESDMEWARDKTILLFGDSIERNLLVDFCDFTDSRITLVDYEETELEIPYPPGEELPPIDYINYKSKNRTWSQLNDARPHFCHIARLNLNLVSVFHYSTKPLDHHLNYHPHYYPPAKFDERFNSIVLPLLEKLHTVRNITLIPDLVILSPGYWGLFRDGLESEKLGLDPYEPWTEEKIQSQFKSVESMIKIISQAWKLEKIQPKFVYKLLHQTKDHPHIPNPHINTLNSIGKQVISQLNQKAESESEKIIIDEWGTKFVLGAERQFRDQLHPGRQSSWIFGQMLLNHLKMNS